MLSPAGTPHVIVGKPVDASGLPSTILQVSQETQEVPGTEPQEHVPPQPKRQRPSIASTEETPSDKKKVSRTSDAGIAVNLTGSQDVFPSPGVRGASMKTELSWYHSEWVPVDEQLGHKVTMDLIPILKQRNAKMKCKHCKGERSFNPTTRYKDHLLSSCKEFAQTETFQSELVQRHLQEMKSKLAKKAKISSNADASTDNARRNGAHVEAAKLLVHACVCHNVPLGFIHSEEFKQFVETASRGAYQVPTREAFFQQVTKMSQIITGEVASRLRFQTFFGMEGDAWTCGSRHYYALTSTGQDESLFIGCFDINQGDASIENQSAEMHKSALASLGIRSDLCAHDSDIPMGKVAAITTGTTHNMSATVDFLSQNYRLFHRCFHVPCFAQNMAHFMADQVKVDAIKDTLKRAYLISTAFESGPLNMLLSMHGGAKICTAVPAATRFHACSTMCVCLQRAKAALQLACYNPEFLRLAIASWASISRKQSDDEMVTLLGSTHEADFDAARVPAALLGHPQLAAIYMSVACEDFWARVDAYVQLNSIVVTCITEVSKGCALLSDAALAYLSINDHVKALTEGSFPMLLANSIDLAVFQMSWSDRMRRGMTDELYAALLIDARQHVREFVRSEQTLIGTVELNNFGATDAIQRALKVVAKFADVDVPADDKIVQSKTQQGMPVQDAKVLVLGTHLRAFIGVHPKITTKKLKIADEALSSCVMGTSPMSFWHRQVPETVWLRLLAGRLLSARPTCRAAQRTWDVFGDVLRKRQCPVGRGRASQLLHSRMNMQLLPLQKLSKSGLDSSAPVADTLFEAVAQLDEEEEIAARAAHAAALAAIPSASAASNPAPLRQRSDDDSVCTDDY